MRVLLLVLISCSSASERNAGMYRHTDVRNSSPPVLHKLDASPWGAPGRCNVTRTNTHHVSLCVDNTCCSSAAACLTYTCCQQTQVVHDQHVWWSWLPEGFLRIYPSGSAIFYLRCTTLHYEVKILLTYYTFETSVFSGFNVCNVINVKIDTFTVEI